MSRIAARRTRMVVPLVLLALLAAAGSRAAPDAGPAVPRFDHVIVVVFENKEYSRIAGNPSAPTFNKLAARYARLDNLYAITHPSLPNYIALVSGSTQGITDDCTECSVRATSLADTLETAGRSWKTYAEGLPYPGFTGGGSGNYAKRHNPFPYFQSIASNKTRLARIVPMGQFSRDLAAGRLPSFSLVVPDVCDDMHDCAISRGDSWLKRLMAPILSSRRLGRTVVFVTFDEGRTAINGGGQIFAFAAGSAVRRGVHVRTRLSTYSILRTVEESWHLPLLGNSASAPPITGIWK